LERRQRIMFPRQSHRRARESAPNAESRPAEPPAGGGADQTPGQEFGGLGENTHVTDLINNRGNAVILAGLRGNASTPDRSRLYLTLQLDTYVEFNNADVLSYEELDDRPETGINGYLVWLRKDAVIEAGRVQVGQLLQNFMQGELMAPLWPLPFASGGPGYSGAGASFACGGGTYNCGGGTYNCGGGTYNCGGGTYNCGGGTYNCGGGTYHCGGGTYHCGGGGWGGGWGG
jgi:hypothetical protein